MTRKRILLAAVLITSLVCLVWIARREFAQPTYHGKTIRTLSANLFARDQKSREEAQAGLHFLGTNAVPELVRLLKIRESAFDHAIDSIVRRIPPIGRKLIGQRVASPPVFVVQMQAAHGLGEIGPDARQAIPALFFVLRQGDARVRMESADALGRIGEEAVPALVSALSDKTADIRRAAASGLAAPIIPSSIATPILLKALQDSDSSVAYAVRAGIGQRGNDLLPCLTNLIQTGDVSTRVLAARAMTMFRPNRQIATPVLIKLATDADESCRFQAIRTLTAFQLPNRLILNAFCAALKDPSTEVRQIAVQGLGQVRRQVAFTLPKLTNSLHDPAPEVREAAAVGIGSLGVSATNALPELKRVVEQDSDPVRQAAKDAIQKIEVAEMGRAGD